MSAIALLLLLTACAAPAAEQDSRPASPSNSSATSSPAVQSEPSPSPSENVIYVTPGPKPSARPSSLDEATLISYGPAYLASSLQGEIPIDKIEFRVEVLPDQSCVSDEIDYFYKDCKSLGAALASAMAAFPSIAAHTDLDPSDPIGAVEHLYYSPDGGEDQRELLAELQALLESPDTTVQVVHVSGMVQMTQGYIWEENLEPGSCVFLAWTEPFLVCDATQIEIAHTCADGTQEVGYFDCSFRHCLTVPAALEIVTQ